METEQNSNLKWCEEASHIFFVCWIATDTAFFSINREAKWHFDACEKK